MHNQDANLLSMINAGVSDRASIVAISLQGSNQFYKNSFVSQFSLSFSNDSVNWITEEEPLGKPKIYRCHQCKSQRFTANEVIVYNLLKPVLARFVRLQIVEYKNSPCLRMEVYGCRAKRNCAFNLTTTTGTIASPSYPFYYGQDSYCSWRISPPTNNHSVELNFLLFDLAPKTKRSG